MNKLVNQTIEEASNCNYIVSISLKDLTKEDLIDLTEKANKQDLLVTLKEEHSYLHQGVLVNVVRKAEAKRLLMHL